MTALCFAFVFSFPGQWYRIRTANGSDGSESAASLAWYFHPEELAHLETTTQPSVAAATSTVSSPSTSDIFTDADVEPELPPLTSTFGFDDDDADDAAHPLSKVTFARYCELARISKGSAAPIDDVMLVKMVNGACDRVGVEPINLPPRALLEEARIVRGAGGSYPQWLDDEDGIQARFAVLLHLNQMVLRVLPFVCLSPRVEVGFTGAGAGAAVAVADFGAAGLMSERWRGAGFGRWLRRQRACLFRGTKLAYWNDVLAATSTPTALSQVRALLLTLRCHGGGDWHLLPGSGGRHRRAVLRTCLPTFGGGVWLPYVSVWERVRNACSALACRTSTRTPVRSGR